MGIASDAGGVDGVARRGGTKAIGNGKTRHSTGDGTRNDPRAGRSADDHSQEGEANAADDTEVGVTDSVTGYTGIAGGSCRQGEVIGNYVSLINTIGIGLQWYARRCSSSGRGCGSAWVIDPDNLAVLDTQAILRRTIPEHDRDRGRLTGRRDQIPKPGGLARIVGLGVRHREQRPDEGSVLAEDEPGAIPARQVALISQIVG